MRQLVYSALALSVASAPVFAGSDWLSLDSELEALPAFNLDSHGGPHVGGYIQSVFMSNGDSDTMGFDVTRARIAVSGNINEDVSYKLQFELAGASEDNDGTVGARDLYLQFPVATDINARFGQFKTPFLRSGLVSASKLFFLGRGVNGGMWAGRDEGIQISGAFDQIQWAIGVQDGSDGDTDEYRMSLHASIDLMGDALTGSLDESGVEGAVGYNDSPSIRAGIGFSDDGNVDDGDAMAIEVNGGTSVYSFGVDMVSYGEGAGDNSPMSISGTYMLTPNTWELGVRFNDMDDAAETSDITIAANHYMGAEGNPHGLKWTFQYNTVSSDSDALETDTLSIGLLGAF